MTLIVGIVCKEGIAVASDSQMTTEQYKSVTRCKIHLATFLDESQVIIANSGVINAAEMTVRFMQECCRSVALESDIQLFEIVGAAMNKTRQHIVESLGGDKVTRSDEEKKKLWMDNHFSLMVAASIKQTPFLYTFQFLDGFPNKPDNAHVEIGIDLTPKSWT